ncbi:MAG: mechanosensitive ion channel [Rhizobiaceae bacterium]|nr:mechanosensitive ion channel [Rhizobiaceae bacterium]
MTNIIKLLFVIAVLGLSVNLSQAQVPNISSADPNSQEIFLPEPLTPQAIRELVSKLSDQEVRALLLQRLDAVANEKAQPAKLNEIGIIEQLSSWGSSVGNNITTAIVRIPTIWDGLKNSTSNLVKKIGTERILNTIVLVIGAISAGLLAEFAVNRITRARRDSRQDLTGSPSLLGTLKILGSRFFWDIIALVVFFAVTRAIIQTVVSVQMLPLVTLFMVQLVVIPRWVWAFSRFLNAPKHPQLRLINATDEVATFFHRTMIGLVILIGFTTFIIQFHIMNGVPPGETRIGFWLNVALYIWLVVSAYFVRDGMTQVLIGEHPEEVTPAELKVARIFPWFAIGFAIFMWVVVEIIAGMGRFDLLGGREYIVLALVTFTPVIDTIIRALVRHMVPPMQGTGTIAHQAYYSTKRSYIRIGRVVSFALVIMLIARLWNIDFGNLASAGVGAQIAGRFFEASLVIAIGYLIWEFITLLINRKLAAEMTAAGFDLDDEEPGGGEGGGAGGSRLSTVLPMIRFTLQITIVVMTVLIALANIGVDITPLLAGAGILGIAIGFGAQSLVKDIVSGLFFLVEDAFRVGEYLNINETVGTVEKISLRSLQLRHHNGPIHTIPFGEIPKVTNLSRDWVIMKLKWTLPFGTDPQKIKKLFKEIGKEMMDAEYADNIIQSFKSQGVYDVDDVGIVIRGKFMAKPGTQWIMRKDVYARVQRKLEDNGIEFARREVRVNVPGLNNGKELDENGKNAISAAAAQAVQSADQTVKKELPDTP